jgi:hypothetical protein
MKNKKETYSSRQLWLIALSALSLPTIYEYAYWFGMGLFYDAKFLLGISDCINSHSTFLVVLSLLFISLSICKTLISAPSQRGSSCYKSLWSKYGYIMVFFLIGTIIIFLICKDLDLYGLPAFSSIIIISILEFIKASLTKEERPIIYITVLAMITSTIAYALSTAHLKEFEIAHNLGGKVEIKDMADEDFRIIRPYSNFVIVYNKKLNKIEVIPMMRVKEIELGNIDN